LAKEDLITETRHVKRLYTQSEMDEFLRQMFMEQDVIEEKQADLDAYKKSINGEIAQHEANAGALKNKLRTGYEQVPIQCIVKYENGKALYINKSTGEFIEERAMTEQEQMKLAGGFTDAEQIIRADSEKKMEEDAEDEDKE
jgi:hypothetical protein